jgi:hypothetical protein
VGRLIVRRNAVSEMLGAILIALITISMAVTYVSLAGQSASRQAMSLCDLMRVVQKRQRQLLSLAYWSVDGSGRVHLYIYNYGKENATIWDPVTKQYGYIYVQGSRVKVQMYEVRAPAHRPMSDSEAIRPGILVDISFTPPSQSPTLDILLWTGEGAFFVWKISLPQ